MADSIPVPSHVQAQAVDRVFAATDSIPWYIWSCLIALLSGDVGFVWDISWHASIGRDSFWTAPHMLIYMCGVLAGISCGYLILRTTFQKDSRLYSASVTMWGFRGPLGAFICSWGALAMITSAPFDNWWHNAYGLDVKIFSPPHVLLAIGVMAIRFGTMVFVLAEMNRAIGEYREKLERLLLFTFSFLIGTSVGIMQEYTNRVEMHQARFYFVIMMTAPIWLAAVSRVSRSKWAATIITGLWTVIHGLFVWVLPLFPAQPKLGPVYQNITHLVPPDFPLLLIGGTIAFDLARRWLSESVKWTQAFVLGPVFFAAFAAVQWPFADFLMSDKSRNWFFATGNFPYFMPASSLWVRNQYFDNNTASLHFWLVMGYALIAAILMTRIGLGFGDWMRRIRR